MDDGVTILERNSPPVASDLLVLEEDRFFDSDPTIRRTARTPYAETRELPIDSLHEHVDGRLLAEELSFSQPTALLTISDHYNVRLLYSAHRFRRGAAEP